MIASTVKIRLAQSRSFLCANRVICLMNRSLQNGYIKSRGIHLSVYSAV